MLYFVSFSNNEKSILPQFCQKKAKNVVQITVLPSASGIELLYLSDIIL